MSEPLPEQAYPFETAEAGIKNGGQWARRAWDAPVRLFQPEDPLDPPKLFVPGVSGFTGNLSQADKDATDWYQAG